MRKVCCNIVFITSVSVMRKRSTLWLSKGAYDEEPHMVYKERCYQVKNFHKLQVKKTHLSLNEYSFSKAVCIVSSSGERDFVDVLSETAKK